MSNVDVLSVLFAEYHIVAKEEAKPILIVKQ